MSASVTQRQFKTAVAKLATKTELEAAVAKLATKAELEAAVAKLATKAELEAAVAKLATKAELELWGGALSAKIDGLADRLSVDLARHVSAILDANRRDLGVIDDKYADLPGRVSVLESHVLPK